MCPREDVLAGRLAWCEEFGALGIDVGIEVEAVLAVEAEADIHRQAVVRRPRILGEQREIVRARVMIHVVCGGIFYSPIDIGGRETSPSVRHRTLKLGCSVACALCRYGRTATLCRKIMEANSTLKAY